ncbi:hypothetical protein EG329_013528 [Mollisiaceae sp. DMI_Dod_QoI]|nr:hypothetical protein EG329_013528 [Helotiales sp. DMI_Dod_QoI]
MDRPNFFNSIPQQTVAQIVWELDLQSASNLARTSSLLAALCVQVHGPAVAPYHSTTGMLVTRPNPASASVSFASPTSSESSSDSESHGNTETDMTSSPEEEDWEFEITPDLIQRLSLLPDRAQGHTLPTLPTEMQLEIFSYLDQIDSCCLGLAHPNLYVVFRAIHGTKMPLNTRRIGPNRLESAWEVVGKQECKQCGIYRCELHQHIKSWMPKDLEYCAMKGNFGLQAKEGANATCYRGKPSKPKRCGRHPLRTTSVHQDDASFNLPTPGR